MEASPAQKGNQAATKAGLGEESTPTVLNKKSIALRNGSKTLLGNAPLEVTKLSFWTHSSYFWEPSGYFVASARPPKFSIILGT